MKRMYFTMIAVLGLINDTSGQPSIGHYYLSAINAEKVDTLQTQLVLQWMDKGAEAAFGDSMRYFARKILETGMKLKNRDVQALGYMQLAYSFYNDDDLPTAMDFILKGLHLGEKQNNKMVLTRLYHVMSFFYEDFRGIEYSMRSIALARQLGKPHWECLALDVMGHKYYNRGMYDSSLLFFQQAYQLSLQVDKMKLGFPILKVSVPVNIGKVYIKLEKPVLAFAYYRMAMDEAVKLNIDRAFQMALAGLSEYYHGTGTTDSSLSYASRLYTLVKNKSLGWEMHASKLLYEVYSEKEIKDSALKYLEVYTSVKDSLNSIYRVQKIENLRFAEELRKNEQITKQKQLANQRRHNLQYGFIGLGIISILIIFFLLTRSIIVTSKFVKFMGVVGLLLLYEFINLLIHPLVGIATSNSPLWMFMIMFCIAFLLVPAHHRIEEWITHQLVEKNKRIRLEAAKKTIQQLEDKR